MYVFAASIDTNVISGCSPELCVPRTLIVYVRTISEYRLIRYYNEE